MFDIASVLKDVSGPGTGKEQIEYIQLDQIDPDPNNFYSLEGLDDLAANIELIGLQQPLRVRPGSEPGRYVIVSGHRRRAAILMIRDGGSGQFDGGVPCIVERGEASEALRELRLIYANSATRVMSAAEISKQAERVEMLLYTLKEEGMEFPGRMRDHVAEACQVSKTKLARLHAIRKNLLPELLFNFDHGYIGETVAYRISQEDKKTQRALMHDQGSLLQNLTVDGADRVIARIKRPAPDPQPEIDSGPGWDAEAYLENRQREDDEFFEMMNEIADKFLWKLEALNTRQEGIERLKQNFRNAGGTYIALSWNGDANGLVLKRPERAQIRRSWTEVYDMLCTIALNRAAMELYTKAETCEEVEGDDAANDLMISTPAWLTGEPDHEGRYYCRVIIGGDAKPHEQRMEWKDGRWMVFGEPAGKYQIVVHGWWPLPPEVER